MAERRQRLAIDPAARSRRQRGDRRRDLRRQRRRTGPVGVRLAPRAVHRSELRAGRRHGRPRAAARSSRTSPATTCASCCAALGAPSPSLASLRCGCTPSPPPRSRCASSATIGLTAASRRREADLRRAGRRPDGVALHWPTTLTAGLLWVRFTGPVKMVTAQVQAPSEGARSPNSNASACRTTVNIVERRGQSPSAWAETPPRPAGPETG